MAWDPSRPVPWNRLSREWLVYALVMIVAFVVFLRDTVTAGSILGLAASYPLYLGFGGILAKFGYRRRTWRDLREEAREKAPTATATDGNAPRRRPAPTRRTSSGPPNRRKKKR